MLIKNKRENKIQFNGLPDFNPLNPFDWMNAAMKQCENMMMTMFR